MNLAFLIPACVVLAGAIAAMSLPNLVHCALCLTATFVGLAVLYLQLGAEFIGFAQILVYVGAVAILILFAILLTRGGGPEAGRARWSQGWWVGTAVAAGTVLCLASAIRSSRILPATPAAAADSGAARIGRQLFDTAGDPTANYLVPLLVTGILLTAALIGAVLLALRDESPEAENEASRLPERAPDAPGAPLPPSPPPA